MQRKLNLIWLSVIITMLTTISSCKKDALNVIDGYNSLIDTFAEAPGTNCAVGGLKVAVGLDSNRNGTLDAAEVNKTTYICNNSPKIYAVRIDQVGGKPPLATLIQNTLKLNITWSRISTGRYKGELDQNLDLSKSIILSNNIDVLCRMQSANVITLDHQCGVNAYCDEFSGLNLEIRVY